MMKIIKHAGEPSSLLPRHPGNSACTPGLNTSFSFTDLPDINGFWSTGFPQIIWASSDILSFLLQFEWETLVSLLFSLCALGDSGLEITSKEVFLWDFAGYFKRPSAVIWGSCWSKWWSELSLLFLVTTWDNLTFLTIFPSWAALVWFALREDTWHSQSL